jgi:hypothetical protein
MTFGGEKKEKAKRMFLDACLFALCPLTPLFVLEMFSKCSIQLHYRYILIFD